MKQLFDDISLEEKNRIMEMHKIASDNLYLNEQNSITTGGPKPNQTPQQTDYSSIEQLLLNLDRGSKNYYSYWFLDPKNPKINNRVFTATNQFLINDTYKNKPLIWSLVVNGKTDQNSFFVIEKKGNKFYVDYSLPIGAYSKRGYKELTMSTLKELTELFNSCVRAQKTQ